MTPPGFFAPALLVFSVKFTSGIPVKQPVYKADKKTVASQAAIAGKGGTKLVLMGNGRLMVTNTAGCTP
jgi:hypothetical protein